jgi:hypothetical protein
MSADVTRREMDGEARVGAQRAARSDGMNLTVSSVDGIAALERFAAEIDRLNQASAHPNPFLSSAFLLSYALRSEYYVPGKEERLYLIREGDRLIGCAPMRFSKNHFGIAGALPLTGSGSLRFLAPLDSEHPGILSAAEDGERVAAALIRCICNESGCGMIEFAGQQPGAVLYRVAHAAAAKFRVRDIKVEPYNDIPIVWESLAAYFQSLVKKMRSNISRQARRLFSNGEVQLILAEGGEAVSAWFDVYSDLDSRSWKHNTGSSIRRHPRRVRFYREIAAGKAGLYPEFIGVVLDGVLIAGLLMGSNSTWTPPGHGAWCLEMAYDQSRADLGPGQLLLLLAVGRAIEKNHRHLSFMQNFAYYKHRWGAEAIEVVNVQLIRRSSLHNVRASLGDLKQKLRPKPKTGEAAAAEVNQPSEGVTEKNPSPTANNLARELTAAALTYAGAGVRCLDRESSKAHLPFDIE